MANKFNRALYTNGPEITIDQIIDELNTARADINTKVSLTEFNTAINNIAARLGTSVEDINDTLTAYATKEENARKLDKNSLDYLKSVTLIDRTFSFTKGNGSVETLDPIPGVDYIATGTTPGTISVSQNGMTTNISIGGYEDMATLTSPTFKGIPKAPTASAGTNTNQIATTAFVNTAVSNLVDSAPETLDTLKELAVALGNNPNFASTMATNIGNKVDKTSHDYIKNIAVQNQTIYAQAGDDTISLHTIDTGVMSVITGYENGTIRVNDETVYIRGLQTAAFKDAEEFLGANEQAVDSACLGGNPAANYALLNNPAFTGIPTAPTATAGTNTKQLATTAFTQEAVRNKADKATTLAGYGITDAYTKTETDTKLGTKADKATTLAGYNISDAYTKTETDTKLNTKANKSTTLSGYGVTDAYTKNQVDSTVNTINTNKADKATTLAGYGITDAYTKAQIDDVLNSIEANAAGKATTLAGYGITDAYTKTEIDSTISSLTSGKADKATTLAGYGITNAYTKTETDNKLATKAAKATSLSGYGITDAYTKTETDTKLSAKADKATTLNGYGITNAYTKSEVDTLLSGKASTDHNQASNTIDALTGYSKPSGTSALKTSDTLNAALGKLEKAIENNSQSITNIQAASGGPVYITWDNVQDKPSTFSAAAHNHGTNEINELTGYSIASSVSALSASDTLNSALGKLEKAINVVSATGYIHPTTSGYKHIPSGGSSGQILKWSSDGTAVWGTIEVGSTYSNATTSSAGLMSAADKTKLDGIASGAQVNAVTGVKGNAETSYRTGNINITAANIGAALTNHEQASNTITSMTGYSKASSASAITTSDSLNTAIGKLEKALENSGSVGLIIY